MRTSTVILLALLASDVYAQRYVTTLGDLAADPGGACVNNARYYNTATSKVRVCQGAAWVDDVTVFAIGATVASATSPTDDCKILIIGPGPVLAKAEGLCWDDTNKKITVTDSTPTGAITFEINNGAPVFTVSDNGVLTVAGTAAPDVTITDAATGTFSRARAAAGAGTSTQLVAGGAQVGATDAAGGNLVLSAGTSTGDETAIIQLETPITSGTTGTTDRAPVAQATLSGSAFAPCANGVCTSGAALVATATWNNYFGPGNEYWTDVITTPANDQPIIVQHTGTNNSSATIELRSCVGTDFACSAYSGATTVTAAGRAFTTSTWGASPATTYPVIAYGAVSPNVSARMRFCTSADCSTLGTEIVLDTDASREDAYNVSIATTPVSNEVVGLITYFESTGSLAYLKYFRCSDPPTCSSITTTAISAGVYGAPGAYRWAVLGVGTDGVNEYPVVFFTTGASSVTFWRGADLTFGAVTSATTGGFGFLEVGDTFTPTVRDTNGEVVAVTTGTRGANLIRCSPAACTAVSAARTFSGTSFGIDGGGMYGIYSQPSGYVGLVRRSSTSTNFVDLYTDVVNIGAYSTLSVGDDPRGNETTSNASVNFGVGVKSTGDITFDQLHKNLNPQWSIADFTSGTPVAVGLDLGTQTRKWANAWVLGNYYGAKVVASDVVTLGSLPSYIDSAASAGSLYYNSAGETVQAKLGSSFKQLVSGIKPFAFSSIYINGALTETTYGGEVVSDPAVLQALRFRIATPGAGGTPANSTISVSVDGIPSCFFEFACDSLAGNYRIAPTGGPCSLPVDAELAYFVDTGDHLGGCASAPQIVGNAVLEATWE